MNEQLRSLLQQEMTRKQFLTAMGFMIMSIAGLGPILKLLFGHNISVDPFSLPSQPPKSYGRSH